MEFADEKQKLFWEKARRGVLSFVAEKGGNASMSEMHDYSMNKYFIQHQRFSMMMEGFVNDGLVEFDWGTHTATLTEGGRAFLENKS